MMTMKTFFTLTSTIFLGVIVAILAAGSISKNNRLARESYEKIVTVQVDDMKKLMENASETIERLTQENIELTTTLTRLQQGKTPVKTIVKTPTKAATKTTLTQSSLLAHISPSDCWILINSNSYISMHPGGSKTITSMCGKDATAAFTSRGGTGKHSSSAWSLLNQYLVGKLGQTL
jgi:cytochrome b involved in lipid metabolism